MIQVKRCDPRARALADRHYSRQTPGATEFMPPGRTLVYYYASGAVWGVCENLFKDQRRWRVTIFRNEGPVRSSDIIRACTTATYAYWESHYGARPSVPLTTEVDPRRVKQGNPGYCFLMAGWTRIAKRRGLYVFQARES